MSALHTKCVTYYRIDNVDPIFAASKFLIIISLKKGIKCGIKKMYKIYRINFE